MKPTYIALSLFALCGLGSFAGCAKSDSPAVAEASDIDYYTCTMHPSVHSKDPHEKCPICGMDLVPVKKLTQTGSFEAPTKEIETAGDQPHEFTIPLERQQMIGVTYATAETRPLRRTLRAVGLVAATTAKHWDYVARVDGYVHTLYVASAGDQVKKGQVLLDLYSPDLVATENEYVDLIRMGDNGRRDQNAPAAENASRLVQGARARLRQWNISEAQIDEVEKTGAAQQYLQLESPVDGVVEEIAVHQGRHVAVGDHLLDLVDLSSVWVWADFYESELPLLRPGVPVTISGGGLAGRSIPGTIAVIDPFINETKRTGRVRIDVANPESSLRPNAYVDVTLNLDEGEGIAVPLSAVLPTGEHNIVFVDKGSGRLEPRFVKLGGQFGDVYRVTQGLRAGERVVSSANFLVDAESKVQGALKSW
jgi:Cu(I)/Ag(I) efflux system membrane fusion protein